MYVFPMLKAIQLSLLFFSVLVTFHSLVTAPDLALFGTQICTMCTLVRTQYGFTKLQLKSFLFVRLLPCHLLLEVS